jgi:hypothetical protein
VQARPVPASKNSGAKGSEVLFSSVASAFSSAEFSPLRPTLHFMRFILLALQLLQNKKSILRVLPLAAGRSAPFHL